MAGWRVWFTYTARPPPLHPRQREPEGRSPAQSAAKAKRSVGRGREDYGWGWAGGVTKPGGWCNQTGTAYTVGSDPALCARPCVRIGTYLHAKQTNPKHHAAADTPSKIRAPGPNVAATRQIAATVINTYAAVNTG